MVYDNVVRQYVGLLVVGVAEFPTQIVLLLVFLRASVAFRAFRFHTYTNNLCTNGFLCVRVSAKYIFFNLCCLIVMSSADTRWFMIGQPSLKRVDHVYNRWRKQGGKDAVESEPQTGVCSYKLVAVHGC